LANTRRVHNPPAAGSSRSKVPFLPDVPPLC
jgi:hypothetical protein